MLVRTVTDEKTKENMYLEFTFSFTIKLDSINLSIQSSVRTHKPIHIHTLICMYSTYIPVHVIFVYVLYMEHMEGLNDLNFFQLSERMLLLYASKYLGALQN